MDNVPEWVANVMYASLGGLGALILGFMKASSDNNRTRSTDRSEFTNQVLARLAIVENQLQEEREYHDKRFLDMKQDYEERIANRDKIILELRKRDQDREYRLSHLEELVANAL